MCRLCQCGDLELCLVAYDCGVCSGTDLSYNDCDVCAEDLE